MVSFREVELHLCIILNDKIPRLLDEHTDANSLLCYGYVDEAAGLTYQVLALTSYVDGDYTVIWDSKEVSLKIRAESVKNGTVIPVQNKALEQKFSSMIQFIKDGYYQNSEVIKCREVTLLDAFRHPTYPDDLEILLVRNGQKMERIWARCVRFEKQETDNIVFIARLLNEPYGDFSVSNGSLVRCISLIPDGSNDRVCVALFTT